MINIIDKHNCCGCAACVQACPKQCISFNEDRQGFCYPQVDKHICVDCGLCEKVCPVLNQDEPKKPLKVYAAKNPNDEIRMKSSSGGVFTMFAEAIIEQGGVVFGAKFDENWEVEHDYTETKEGLEPFRGSKYVQSRIGNTYHKTKTFLNAGRVVLYVGTSCQIAGLKKFLIKDYKNLLTVDVVCHGVPSPLVWRKYLDQCVFNSKEYIDNNLPMDIQNKKTIVTSISFRDKSTGWKKYGFVVRGKSRALADTDHNVSQEKILLHETLDDNLFMKCFINNLCLRPSCYKCSVKSGKSGSDLTIADFWGIENQYPMFDDNKGTSLVLLNTEKGLSFFDSFDIDKMQSNYPAALAGNPSLESSVNENKIISIFWRAFLKNNYLDYRIINHLTKAGSIIRRINNKIKTLFDL